MAHAYAPYRAVGLTTSTDGHPGRRRHNPDLVCRQDSFDQRSFPSKKLKIGVFDGCIRLTGISMYRRSQPISPQAKPCKNDANYKTYKKSPTSCRPAFT